MKTFRWLSTMEGALMFALLLSNVSAQDWDPKPKTDIDAGGDKTKRPVIFIHGMRGAGEQFERQAMHFASNGYPVTWITAYDYDGVGRGRGPEGIDKFIDEVLKKTGADKVDLVGHSRGTAESQRYLTSDPKRAAKVAHYANVGGSPANNVGGVPTAVFGSPRDAFAGEGEAREGAKHFIIDDVDHVALITGPKTFEQLYAFFNDGKKPTTLDWTPQNEIQVGGYALTNGQNNPAEGATVEVWEVAAATGRHEKDKPLVTLTVGADGRWGPFRAMPGQHYEFEVAYKTYEGKKRFFREPFKRSDNLVYFRLSSAAEGSTPSPFDTNKEFLTKDAVAMTIRQQNGGLNPRMHSIKVNGTEISVAGVTDEKATISVVYIVDANKNGKTDITGITEAPWKALFVAAADMYLPANAEKSISVSLNGRTLNVPALSGAESGPLNVIFD